jgi:signal transduction histidine kinase
VLNYARVRRSVVLTYALEEVPVGETIASVRGADRAQMRAKAQQFQTMIDEPDLAARADREESAAGAAQPARQRDQVHTDSRSHRRPLLCGGDRIVIKVSDTGVGISEDNLSRVFERSSRSTAGSRVRTKAFGLGLAISRDLARGMGGDLRAESVVGVGSTFTLTLPRA